jgi:hypothetical protein
LQEEVIMRTLLLVLSVAIIACGCGPSQPPSPGGPQPLPDGLKIGGFKPAVPAELATGERLNVTVEYRVASCAKARIFARPYTGGKKTPGFGAHSSPIYTRGTGQAVCWFTLNQPGVVDEVRVEMVDEATGKVVESIQQRIKAKWGAPSPDALKIASFKPAVPAKLRTGNRLNVTVAYRIKTYEKVRIFARPYTKGEKTPGFAAHPSPIYTRGTGQTVCWFTLNQPGVVDEVRVEMVDEASGKVVAEVRQSINAQWAKP